MSETEMFDIYTKDMKKLGTASREEVHAKGWWHQTFHCWIIKRDAQGEIYLLFQRRHPNKDVFPLLLDTSCAGHLQAGEDAKDGIRELEEELGLAVPVEDLTYLGRVAQEHFPSPDLIDREVNHVFIYENEKPLLDYRIQTEELTGLYWVGMLAFQELRRGERDELTSTGVYVDEANGVLKEKQATWRLTDFTPNSDEYYQMLFDRITALF
ncbi:NUDIX domain-containing protein [Paenibacillus phoenicis]|uniref:NUDIX domain-containing protein n=1 Tax=Paenibacillus phoenicis TaxID=554117 RepID=A0ABU5PH05_9BACL|nr:MULTISPECIES: NUDIX domain-containing protein [Paenibacillus]EES74943.1 hydrolase, NUDIX family [Paenibacillus sp. oral taxon 786 str. D14]MCT2196462.1 NUDIX domain-containing protein [Paenibacillus sp. p3-SID1389]MEA3569155.1 NUDIX domain-containing protein [Paenibacillus phoenicis]